MKIGKRFSNRFKFHFGSEYIFRNYSEEVSYIEDEKNDVMVRPGLAASFAETDLNISKSLALKLGVRGSWLSLQKEFIVSPRISMAVKAGQDGQISLAYGEFLQQAEIDHLKFDTSLRPEQASHYILNYQWTRPGYTLRAEAFYKDYRDLVKYDTPLPQFNSPYSNLGKGYAGGIDFFYRDDRSIENLQYWISYSFIDSERDFKNYPEQVTPQFVAKHTASLVTKFWVNSIRSQLGFTYSFATGRPFEDPNSPGFMDQKTRNYNNLSFNWAYLLSPQKILYLSASNLPGFRNVFNYEYAAAPNASGLNERRAVTPVADRFFFVGFFWTISKDKSKNQLDTL